VAKVLQQDKAPPVTHIVETARYVSTSTQVNAQTQHRAADATCVAAVAAQNLSSGVSDATLPQVMEVSHLNRQAWEHLMQFHPDKTFRDLILKYIDEGVPIGYEGPNVDRVCKNWNSCVKYKDAVQDIIATDVIKGRKSGPFSRPPVKYFVGSPMGAFQKRRSTKIRVINDLSWPPGEVVNDFISKENSAVQYITIDDAVARVKQLGKDCLICKLDLADAYKSIVVRPADWHLLGTTWQKDNGETDYYLDHVLPFGLRSSAQLFNLFATALEFCMLLRGTTHASHYLDDYMSSGRPNSEECNNNLKIMIETCQYLGMEVNFNKVFTPSTTMEFLGIIIDTSNMELRMSEERLEDIIQELNSWKRRGSGIKRDLLSLLGI
jgi:hypothetical protein